MSNKGNPPLSPEKYLRTRARTLPIATCFLNKDWLETGFAAIFVVREHINGNVTHGTFLVDLFCQGLKDSYWDFNQPAHTVKEIIKKTGPSDEPDAKLEQVHYTLVHNIIYGAIAYALDFGITAHKSFDQSKYILEEDDERIEMIEIEFGYKGKPLLIYSPERPGDYLKAKARLDASVGPENYYFIQEVDANEFFEKENEEIDDEPDPHAHEFKESLIRRFVSELPLLSKPKKKSHAATEEMGYLFIAASIILLEYMSSPDEVREAEATIAAHLDIDVSDETFTDAFLFGPKGYSGNPDAIRVHAEHLVRQLRDGKTKKPSDEVTKYIHRFPEIPVFQYLYLTTLDIVAKPGETLDLCRKYADRNPGYEPIELIHLLNTWVEDHRCTQEGPETLPGFVLDHDKITPICRVEAQIYFRLLNS